jgi:hypothetical protein
MYFLSEVTEEDREKISVRIIKSLIVYADYNFVQWHCFKFGDFVRILEVLIVAYFKFLSCEVSEEIQHKISVTAAGNPTSVWLFFYNLTFSVN